MIGNTTDNMYYILIEFTIRNRSCTPFQHFGIDKKK